MKRYFTSSYYISYLHIKYSLLLQVLFLLLLIILTSNLVVVLVLLVLLDVVVVNEQKQLKLWNMSPLGSSIMEVDLALPG